MCKSTGIYTNCVLVDQHFSWKAVPSGKDAWWLPTGKTQWWTLALIRCKRRGVMAGQRISRELGVAKEWYEGGTAKDAETCARELAGPGGKNDERDPCPQCALEGKLEDTAGYTTLQAKKQLAKLKAAVQREKEAEKAKITEEFHKEKLRLRSAERVKRVKDSDEKQAQKEKAEEKKQQEQDETRRQEAAQALVLLAVSRSAGPSNSSKPAVAKPTPAAAKKTRAPSVVAGKRNQAKK